MMGGRVEGETFHLIPAEVHSSPGAATPTAETLHV